MSVVVQRSKVPRLLEPTWADTWSIMVEAHRSEKKKNDLSFRRSDISTIGITGIGSIASSQVDLISLVNLWGRFHLIGFHMLFDRALITGFLLW